jgi:hypothetical protein
MMSWVQHRTTTAHRFDKSSLTTSNFRFAVESSNLLSSFVVQALHVAEQSEEHKINTATFIMAPAEILPGGKR